MVYMAKPWDSTMKKLVRANPQAFLSWLLPNAHFKRELPQDLKLKDFDVDTLLLVALDDDQEMLVAIEFQTYNDPTMAERLLRYNVLIRCEYKLPVLSFVIYLLKDGQIQQSPLRWDVPTGQEVLWFHFESIELGELSVADLLNTGQINLLPLLPLTKDGARRDVVNHMLTELQAAGRLDLMLLGYTFASLVFSRKNKFELEWLFREFSGMRDIFRDSPIYQIILDEGIEKGRKQEREAFRQTLLQLIKARFSYARTLQAMLEKIASIEDTETLQELILKVSMAQTLDEAEDAVLEYPTSSTETN